MSLIKEILGWLTTTGEIVGWLIPTWICAYILRYTAPVTCPSGKTTQYCKDSHLLHVDRQNALWCVGLGMFWPLWILAALVFGFTKSVEGAANHTPVPKLKTPVTDKQLEAADKELEESGKEIARLREEQLNRRHHANSQVIQPSGVWTPPTDPDSDPVRHSH